MDRRTARFLARSFVGSAVVLAGVDLVLVALAWGGPTPTGSFGVLGFAAVIGYPPLLADRGLAAAIEAQARKAALTVEVSADGVARYPQEVEAAAYFCCLEALQNATKNSGASSLRVELTMSDGRLEFDVVDDGRGFDPETIGRGSGLQNMADRLEAVGGSLEIRSAPEKGTTIAGRIPVEEVATG